MPKYARHMHGTCTGMHGRARACMHARACWGVHACTGALGRACMHGRAGACMHARASNMLERGLGRSLSMVT